MKYDDGDTVMTHPHFPGLRIVRHPFSALAGESLKNVSQEGIRSSNLYPPSEDIPILDIEKDNDTLEPDIVNALQNIHPDFAPHVKGDINVLSHGENLPKSHLLWDRSNFPYTKSLKGINYKPPSRTLEHRSDDPEETLKYLISTNLIHHYLRTNKEAPAKIAKLIEAHKELHGHKLPEFTTDRYPAKEGSYRHPRPHLTQMSGLDKLKLVLGTSLMPGKQFSGLSGSLRRATDRSNQLTKLNEGITPNPQDIHSLRLLNLAKDILEHAIHRKPE